MKKIKEIQIKVKNVLQQLRLSLQSLLGVALQHIYVWNSKLNAKRRSFFFLHARSMVRLFILICSTLFAIIFCTTVNFSSLNFSSISNWFVAIGGMIGGTFAIVFTLLEYAQSNSAYLQSNRLYRDYIHDRGQKLSYLFFAFVILYFVFFAFIFASEDKSAIQDNARWIIGLGIYLVSNVLIVIDYLHEQSFLKSQPLTQIGFIRKRGVDLLDDIKKDVDKVALIIRLRQHGTTKESSQNLAYILRSPRLNDFANYIEYITNIISILAQQRKINDVQSGIDVINLLIDKYLEYRKDNSSIHLSEYGILNFESDNQAVLIKILESVNRLGRYFITEDFEVNAVDLVRLYENITTNALAVKYTNALPIGEHPILTKIVWYFNDYIKEAARNNKLEVVFQSLNSYERVGIHILRNRISIADDFLLDQINILHYWGWANNHAVVVDKCREIWISFLLQAVLVNHKSEIGDIVEMIVESLKLSHSSPAHANKYFHSNIQLFTMQLQVKLPQVMNMILRGEIEDPEGVFDLVETICHKFRDYGEKTTNLDNRLLGVMGKFYAFMENFIIKWIKKEQDQKIIDELKDKLLWYVHSPAWFMHEKKAIKLNDYDDLIDSSTVVGIRSVIELEDTKLVESSARALESMLNHFISNENPSIGFDEPRAALRLSYLGVLTLKKGYTDVFEDIKKYLLDFDSKYQEKHKEALDRVSGLSTHQVLMEVWSWRDELAQEKLNPRNHFEILDDLLLDNVEKEDIDRFVLAVWGACDERCSLRAEHEKIMNPVKKKKRSKKVTEIKENQKQD